MEIKLNFYGSFCATSEFKINGMEAESDDFGNKGDDSPESAEDYSCGNMVFIRNPPNSEVLKKYKITIEEYGEIAEKLKEGLSFGSCGMCS